MRYQDIILATVDEGCDMGRFSALFERVDEQFFYHPDITVISQSLLNIHFQIGDDLIRDIISEVCNGYYRKYKLVRSKKILLLLNVQAVYASDLCFSTRKNVSSGTGKLEDLQEYLSNFLVHNRKDAEGGHK